MRRKIKETSSLGCGVKVGDRLRLVPGMHDMPGSEEGIRLLGGETWPCTVIFVHPEGRFYTVKFDAPLSYAESFR